MAGVGRKAKMSKSRKEHPQELENQFILRLPPEQASAVRKMIRSGNAAMKDKLKIDLSSDGRHAVVEVDSVPLTAKMVDLPCVIGSLKTFDGKTFYKTADVSQMLVCSADGDRRSPPGPVTSTDATVTGSKEGETEKKYIWNHGITPPLKNVRKKRFRKTTKKLPDMKQNEESCRRHVDSKDVEKEVKRLLRSDAEAISTRWEVVADEESKAAQSQTCISGLRITPGISGRVSSEYAMPQNIFRDFSSHDDQGKDEDEDEEEEEEEEEEVKEDNSEENLERELQAKFIEFNLCEANEGYDSIITGIQKLIRHKEKKVEDIQGKAQRQKDLLRKLENPTLRSHFQSVLKELKLQEKQKYKQIIFLREQLKHLVKK